MIWLAQPHSTMFASTDEVLDVQVPELRGRMGSVGMGVNILSGQIWLMMVVASNGVSHSKPHRVKVVHPGRVEITTEVVVNVGANRRRRGMSSVEVWLCVTSFSLSSLWHHLFWSVLLFLGSPMTWLHNPSIFPYMVTDSWLNLSYSVHFRGISFFGNLFSHQIVYIPAGMGFSSLSFPPSLQWL